jgi:hypothetical protein
MDFPIGVARLCVSDHTETRPRQHFSAGAGVCKARAGRNDQRGAETGSRAHDGRAAAVASGGRDPRCLARSSPAGGDDDLITGRHVFHGAPEGLGSKAQDKMAPTSGPRAEFR